MIKRYRRTHPGWMRRTSRVYLNELNPSKAMRLRASLLEYSNAQNYAIHKIWASKDFSSELVDKSFTDT
jgi:hypothetical protein